MSNSYLHSGDLGDVIYALPVIRKLGGGRLYLCSRDKTKEFTPARFEAIRALILKCTDFIESVEMHKGQKVTHDFTGFRACWERQTTLSESQAAHVCPQSAPDIDTAWLTAPKDTVKHGRPVFARSPRYHNAEWDSSIWREVIEQYPGAIFVGLRAEHEAFSAQFGPVEFVYTNTLLDVARIIAGSSIFIGNQSSPYAVAEGLKHRTILETHPRIRDCLYPRNNASFITTRRDWEAHSKTQKNGFMLMLQCCPRDVYDARDLTELIVSIEPKMRDDVEFVLMARRDTNPHAIEEIINAAKTKFRNAKAIIGRRRGTGWPLGCNELWQEGMDEALGMVMEGTTNAEGVLTFEPDCIPLRPDWINALRAEFRFALKDGLYVCGHAHNDPRTHINGNAIFKTDILKKFNQLGDSDPQTGWDVFNGKLLLRIARDSNFISQKYRIPHITREEVEAIRKNDVIPAMFHGIKGDTGRNAVRAMIADGTFEARVKGDEPPTKPKQAIDPSGRILISMVCFNKIESTRTCIEALSNNSLGQNYQLVIHNNASTDDTAEFLDWLAEECSNVKVIHNTENVGFIEPNNAAFQMAFDGGYRYFVALNNDTVPPPGWLEALRAPLDADSNAALSGPKGACHSLTDDMHGADGGMFEYVEGSCLCASVKVVAGHGPLFSTYLKFMYGEDADLSLRMREKGHSIHQVDFVMPHERGASRKQSEVNQRCLEAEERNHAVLRERWQHYLAVRTFRHQIVIKRAGAIGDVLLTTAVIRAISEACPASPIVIETDFPELFLNHPLVKAVKTGSVSHPGDSMFINLDMAYEDTPGVHIIEAYAITSRMTVKALGDVERVTELPVSKEMAEWAHAKRYSLVGANGRFAVMHCDKTDWPGKNWPAARFGKVAEELAAMGYVVIAIGREKPSEVEAAEDMTGRLSFGETAALLGVADLFVGIDSFPMNAALAVGCPTIGLFGVSDSRLIMAGNGKKIGLDAPASIPCAGSRHRTSGLTFVDCSPDCINSITVEQVMQAVHDLTA